MLLELNLLESLQSPIPFPFSYFPLALMLSCQRPLWFFCLRQAVSVFRNNIPSQLNHKTLKGLVQGDSFTSFEQPPQVILMLIIPITSDRKVLQGHAHSPMRDTSLSPTILPCQLFVTSAYNPTRWPQTRLANVELLGFDF